MRTIEEIARAMVESHYESHDEYKVAKAYLELLATIQLEAEPIELLDEAHVRKGKDIELLVAGDKLFLHPPLPVEQLPGWKLVPIEPTSEMYFAAEKTGPTGSIGVAWTAMIAASPLPPKGK